MEWNLMEPHGISWNLIEPHGTSWNIMEHHGTSWNLMECHGMSWNTLEPCLQIMLERCGTFWKHVYKYLWSLAELLLGNLPLCILLESNGRFDLLDGIPDQTVHGPAQTSI